MDIHGGKAVMKGPKNYLATAYESIPVAITVEGANIMTRNLMIFGQGAIRSHPYVLKEMELANETDEALAAKKFDEVLFEHIGFTYNNGAKSLVYALTGSVLASAPQYSPVRRYYQHLHRLSAAFALIADVSMLVLQSGLKRREMISARLGDLLSNVFLASMVLKHFEGHGSPEEDLPLVEWSCQYLFNRFQVAMDEVLQNFPNRFIALKLRLLVFPLGKHFDAPADKLERRIAELVQHDTATRRRLLSDVFDGESDTQPLHELTQVMNMADTVAPLDARLKQAVKSGTIPSLLGIELIEAGFKAGVLSEDEAKTMREFDERLMSIIHVDEFAFDAFNRKVSADSTEPPPASKKTTRKKATGTARKARTTTRKSRTTTPPVEPVE